MKAVSKTVDISRVGMYFMVALRIIIGWHFLYEGLIKLGDPTWTAAGYLEQSRYILPGLFHWMAESPGVLAFVDFVNIWGQIFIGLGLMLGLFTRIAAIAGAVLLGMFFLANPPFITNVYSSSLEGHYLFVDKNLIECIALIAVAILPTGHYLGLDKLLATYIYRKRSPRKIVTPEEIEKSKLETEPVAEPVLPRREILKHLATLPILGAFGLAYWRKRKWESLEEQNLADIMSGASVVKMDFPEIDELKGELPMGMIGGKEVSKVILGGNLLNGYAHSRDLIYVSHLIRAYHTKERIFRTLSIAEKCGVNTLVTDPVLAKVINEYWDRKLGKIQFMSDCVGLDYSTGVARAKPFQDWLDFIQMAIDNGATACYIQGETADFYFQQDDGPDKVAKAHELIKSQGLPAGIGAHNIETIKKAVDLGFDPDFWMKTIHHQQYWSAQHPTWHDNKYCFKTEETISFMNDLPQPWIGFKILAAGSIHPEDGFPFAFRNGADFICVGMYDFQMVQDVNIALDCLADPDIQNRTRPWRA